MLTIQNQGDHQNEGVQNAALDGVPDHASIESVQLMVRTDFCVVLGLFDPPDDETGDDNVSNKRDREEGRCNGLDSCDEGGLTGG